MEWVRALGRRVGGKRRRTSAEAEAEDDEDADARRFAAARSCPPERRAADGAELDVAEGGWDTCHAAPEASAAHLAAGGWDTCDAGPRGSTTLERAWNSCPAGVLERRVVLVVDDSEINRRIMGRVLETVGFPPGDVLFACNGLEAVAEYRGARQNGRPVLAVLMDVEMPVMDGIQAVSQIRAIEQDDPAAPHVPIFALSTEINAYKWPASQAGFDGFIAKPPKAARLREVLGELEVHFELDALQSMRSTSARQSPSVTIVRAASTPAVSFAALIRSSAASLRRIAAGGAPNMRAGRCGRR